MAPGCAGLLLSIFLFTANSALVTNSDLPPKFVESIQNVTVTSGRDVKLDCVVDNLGTYKVAWIAYDKSAILTVQENVITRNPRINVSHAGHRTWTLHIEKVNASDAGTYMCQVNTVIAKSQFGFINVVVPPNIVDSESSGDIMLQEGANVTLSCSATGTPMPSITWRREDGKSINLNKTASVVEFEGSELRLARISRTDMAAYLCIARNGVPPIVSKRIQVSVDFPPMMTIPHQLVGSPLNYTITLECKIEAHPPPLTYWTKERGESSMLHHSSKYLIKDEPGDVAYRTIMKLTIKALRPEDYGTYKCIAKNSRGETEGEMKLYRSETPTTTSPSPPSYFEKLFKKTINNAKNSLSDNYNGEEKSSDYGHSGVYPYNIPKPKDNYYGPDYENEVFGPEDFEGTSGRSYPDDLSLYPNGRNRQKGNRDNRMDSRGHFIQSFSSAMGLGVLSWPQLILWIELGKFFFC